MSPYENEELERLRREHGWDIATRARRESGLWVSDGARSVELSYPNEVRRRLAESEDSSFWFGHRSAILEDVLLRTPRVSRPTGFWEIGAGNGFVARGLAGQGLDVVAVEPGFSGAIEAARRGVETIAASLGDLELPDGSLPAAGAMDVIEHLEDPAPLLDEIRRVLVPGGLLLLTVPAFGWLWSAYDEVAGHFRRYTARSLRDEVGAHRFDPIRVSHFMAPPRPAAVLDAGAALPSRCSGIARGAAPANRGRSESESRVAIGPSHARRPFDREARASAFRRAARNEPGRAISPARVGDR